MGWERPLKTPILSLCVKVHEGPCPTEHCGHWVCLCGGVRKNGTSVTVSPLGEQTHGIGGGTCTLGTTRCLESWVLLSMRLFQSSKSTVLRDEVHQQSRQPEFWVQSPGFTPRYWGCLEIRHTPAHSSRGYFQTQPSQNPPNVCFKRLNTALN